MAEDHPDFLERALKTITQYRTEALQFLRVSRLIQ